MAGSTSVTYPTTLVFVPKPTTLIIIPKHLTLFVGSKGGT